LLDISVGAGNSSFALPATMAMRKLCPFNETILVATAEGTQTLPAALSQVTYNFEQTSGFLVSILAETKLGTSLCPV
jgi:hypothetical protein